MGPESTTTLSTLSPFLLFTVYISSYSPDGFRLLGGGKKMDNRGWEKMTADNLKSYILRVLGLCEKSFGLSIFKDKIAGKISH